MRVCVHACVRVCLSFCVCVCVCVRFFSIYSLSLVRSRSQYIIDINASANLSRLIPGAVHYNSVTNIVLLLR